MRQGCPLSPCSYVLVAEVLACDIRSSALISGLTLPGSPSSLPVVSSFPAIFAVFDVYSLYDWGSGAKLNYGKCEGLLLGSWNGRSDSPVNITWSSVEVQARSVVIFSSTHKHL